MYLELNDIWLYDDCLNLREASPDQMKFSKIRKYFFWLLWLTEED